MLLAALQGGADTAPVVHAGDTLFVITTRLGPFSPADRAAAVQLRLARVTDDPAFANDTVRILEGPTTTDVLVGDLTITTVTTMDAEAAGVSRADLAEARAAVIRVLLAPPSVWALAREVALGVLFTLLAGAVLWLALWLMSRTFPAVYRRLERMKRTRVSAIRVQRLELLSADAVTESLILAAKVLRVVLTVALLFYFIPLVFSFFPWTAAWGERVLGYIAAPVRQVGSAFIGYVPNLFYVGVIVAVTYYALKFIHFFFDGIGRGALTFVNFFPEWAEPTYKIVRLLVIAFAFIVIFPYLPGSDSQAFRGVTVFLGVLVSFGSAGAIGNLVAGVVITYMRPFKVGDRVKIADTTGDVIERTLLVTRVQTTKNVEITIPNAMVLSSHIINYSKSANDDGLVLHTTVTIGYDTDWRAVHRLLLAAADRTTGILKDPAPYVLQTALNDFHVSYELNAHTTEPNRMTRIYSDIHQHIQDTFAEAGVEIMSPHYEAERDGNAKAIPTRAHE